MVAGTLGQSVLHHHHLSQCAELKSKEQVLHLPALCVEHLLACLFEFPRKFCVLHSLFPLFSVTYCIDFYLAFFSSSSQGFFFLLIACFDACPVRRQVFGQLLALLKGPSNSLINVLASPGRGLIKALDHMASTQAPAPSTPPS
jgi:hypothetical protein